MIQTEKIPFDLERALMGAEVITGDGRDVFQITEFNVSNDHPLVCVIDGIIRMYRKDGRDTEPQIFTSPSGWALYMKPQKREYWANVIMRKNGQLITDLRTYPSELIAKLHTSVDDEDAAWVRQVLVYEEIK